MKKTFLLLSLFALVLAGCKQKTTTEIPKNEITTEAIDLNGQKLSYTDDHDGDTTLLFLHGALGNKDYWTDQMTYFSPNYRVVALDLPGHGTSAYTLSDWALPSFGKVVSDFINQLGLKNVVVIGHSMSGTIMMDAANQNANVISVVGVDNFKNVGTAMPETQLNQILTTLNNDFQTTMDVSVRQYLTNTQTDSVTLNRVLADFTGADPTIGVPLFTSIYTNTDHEVELLKQLKVPLHLINSTYTPTDHKALTDVLGYDCSVTQIAATSHFPQIEKPEEFNTALQGILNDPN